MSRRCPKCGAEVPGNSLTCPECYTEVPRGEIEDPPQQRETYVPQTSGKSRTVALILAIIPALFGLLGLAQIYKDHGSRAGWRILGLGIIVYLLIVGMVFLTLATVGLMAILTIIPILFLGAVYLITAAACLMDAYLGDAGPLNFLF